MDCYKPYEYKGKTMLLERYLILDERPCTEAEYDIFSMEPEQKIQELLSSQPDLAGYSVFDDLDRELFNTFRYRENAQNKKYYLYTEVISRTKTKIIVNITCLRGKLWVNGKCLSIHAEPHPSQYYLTLYLNKGINHFLLEQLPSKEECRFSILIKNYKFEMGHDVKALSQMSHVLQYDPLIFIHDPYYLPTESEFKFMCVKNNDEYNEDYRIDIHDSHAGLAETISAKLGEIVRIDTGKLRALHEEPLRHEWLGCVFKDKSNKEVVTGPWIVLNDFTEKAAEINQKLMQTAQEQNRDIYEFVMGAIKRQQSVTELKDYSVKYQFSWQNKEILSWIESGRYPYDFYKKPGVHEFFIHSDLDDSFIRVAARVPQGYDPDKPYPVFIALSTANDGWFGWIFPENELSEPCLCFDVTGRGFTGGSYVAEASILEILNWIRINYKIDEDRLYILGQSNGGFASYALAQNYPSLPAAIYPQIGYPQINTIENISNIPAYQVVSPKDHVFVGRENVVLHKLNRYGRYHQYDFKEMLHHHLGPYLTNKKILTDMLEQRRNRYPDTVIYKTCRNRHLESFWIKLHGIAEGKQYGKIKAEIVDSGEIKITAAAVSGVTVTIPPQINRECFRIIVNGKSFDFKNYTKPQVILTKARVWSTAETEIAVDYRKGTGLLDVYLNSMRIILSDHAGDQMQKIADRFAHPNSNGYDPKIYADYPIYKEKEVPNHIFDYNLILLDENYSNGYVKRFADKLPVKYDQSGFTYQGHRFDGNYVIMQVIPNPYDSRLSLLILSTNNEKLVKSHILLRKIVIPTYINGIHKFWNNQILIFDGKQYSCVYERNRPLARIENIKMRVDQFGREF